MIDIFLRICLAFINEQTVAGTFKSLVMHLKCHNIQIRGLPSSRLLFAWAVFVGVTFRSVTFSGVTFSGSIVAFYVGFNI